ncbi:UNVERIFIED_CONTAM: Ferric reduction oxidase 4 [Sesamum latifolium]|uniref:Ferric reduction oxidase 4 n=1 Tax=Sesamum latifolium TaxID=2727402 RepID=A0AAW2T816_9LAMI
MKFRGAWQIFFLLVFVGYMFIWVMLPTKTYKNSWTPKLNEKLNSTYFREQGTNLLLFSFPLMLIAALDVFIYISKRNRILRDVEILCSSKSYYRFLRRPATVMAPLGIVNAVELTFAAMFIALLIWSLANYLYVSFGHLHMHTANEKVWQAKFRSVSLRLGYIGNTCWAFLFFPVTRGSSILPLVGLTSESSIKYHIWLGHVSTVLFAAHSIGFIIYWWAMTDQMYLMLQWSSTYLSNVAGVIAFVLSLGYERTRLVPTRLFPNGSMELTFAKNPVSSSNLETDKLSVVIKSQGSWTRKLYKQLSSSLDHLEVSTEGPYGPASSPFLRYPY